MTTLATFDWRALCAELVKAVDDDVIDTNDGPRFHAVVDRVRTLLSQSELKEAKGSESAVAKTALPVFSDEEIDELWDQEGGYFALYEEVRRFARALIPLVCKAS
jgi:hypothetical protein